ncbi:uncharacterized protein [Littorina saxatilis]|uniref:J domain-containing protein n=1 Tax=Littorina saxatilis TaxID=31220 RepID=A0AAN9BLV7_9CAEN
MQTFFRFKFYEMATQKTKSRSSCWREQGNAAYRQVREGVAPTLWVSRLQGALTCYSQALITADDNAERSSACKNIAMANWKLAKCKVTDDKCKVTDDDLSSSMITNYFKEALKNFQNAREYGRGRDPGWQNSLTVNALSCWNDVRQRVDEWEYEGRISELEKLVAYVIDDMAKAEEYLEIANYYFHWCVTSLGKRDYQTCLRLLGECSFPLNEARRLGQADQRLTRECEMLDNDYFMQQCVAQSIQARVRGNELLDYVMRDEESLNMDMVWEVVDWLRQASQLTRGQDLEMEAMALSDLGKVYHKVLKMKERAKPCLMKAMELAHTMVPRTFIGDEWYEFARSTVEKYQQEQVKAEEDQHQKKRQEVLSLIKEELEVLNKKKNELGRLEFLKFVYTTHPPKLTVDELEELPDWVEVQDLKKLFLKAVVHYHPDKVQEEEHGAKWKVLTEEITKLLTAHYECLK